MSPMRILCLLGILALHSACSGFESPRGVVEPAQKDWQFSFEFNQGLKLNDDSEKTAAELNDEISKRASQKMKFLDPVLFSVEKGFMEMQPAGRFSIRSRSSRAANFSWKVSRIAGAGSSHFANCRVDAGGVGQFVRCDAYALLSCLQQRAERINVEGKATENSSQADKSLLLSLLGDCGVEGAFENALAGNYTFKVESDQVSFSPSPLFSLLVFKGAWATYEEANVQSSAVATLLQDPTCRRSDGLCLQSPLSIARCQGCAGLEKGKLHTVFFLESLRQDQSDVKSIPYVP